MTADATDPVLARYARAARTAAEGGCSCEPPGSPFGTNNYESIDDLPAGAVRASLGCGNPTAVADLHPGETVLDLGSGGGIDVLLSARRVGPTGFAYGLDATVEMVELARRNAVEAGAENVEFVHGNIERIPLPAESVDVVISNCVLVLSPDKHAVFAEIVRVLRPGGRVGISDIVRVGDDNGAEPLVDCGAAAITIDDYDAALRHAGLVAVTIEPTDRLGGGLSNAIVRATKPTARRGDQPAEGGGVPSSAPR